MGYNRLVIGVVALSMESSCDSIAGQPAAIRTGAVVSGAVVAVEVDLEVAVGFTNPVVTGAETETHAPITSSPFARGP